MLLRPTIGLAMLLAAIIILIIRYQSFKLKLLRILRLSLGHSRRTRMAIWH